jgi:hypothetical protein
LPSARGGHNCQRLAQRLVFLHRLQTGAFGRQPSQRLLVEGAGFLPQRAHVEVDGATVGFEQTRVFVPLRRWQSPWRGGTRGGAWLGRLDDDSRRRPVCDRPSSASPTKNGGGGFLDLTHKSGWPHAPRRVIGAGATASAMSERSCGARCDRRQHGLRRCHCDVSGQALRLSSMRPSDSAALCPERSLENQPLDHRL